MHEAIEIKSFKGTYVLNFTDSLVDYNKIKLDEQVHFLIDKKIADLYSGELNKVLDFPNTILIEAIESNKSIEAVIPVIKNLISNKIRRDHCLIGIGGGIIQDITCFIASIIQRGIQWKFIPTTLLAQADSCIGSKSSINLSNAKNILGTFNPPDEISLCTRYLSTLDEKEILSGIGEIIKVHAIKSADAFDRLSADYEEILQDDNCLQSYIKQSLLIKKHYIELDEFDKGPRNIFNYGHSFGHAIEAATNFGIPHGIAVTIGMGLANHLASELGLLPKEHERRMAPLINKNSKQYLSYVIPFDSFLNALMKDKKNTSRKLVVILPLNDDAKICRVELENTEKTRSTMQNYIKNLSK